ncbi:sensor histidine kinase [Paenibacillus sp. OV219]|uniref:cache domain-containing sensor histidine kinase n=1 Tax=Paenibacillus sp. OV219 TaxID=1884377 RepID=UPI0008BB094B|nr:sensor histidine kinase [Paenibacillus sp. OV219]SEM53151.1 two-component system, sensor histidine kinase YesM [Paenibacillus sp. OV219]
MKWLKSIAARRTGQFFRRMEGRLLIVFLFLIILPIGALSYISAQRYSDSIEKNTITFVSQISDRMMVKLDDYMMDMKKISLIPSYLPEIKNALKASNQFYERAAREEAKDAGSIIPNEQMIRLDIQRRVEGSIYFINNIKEGTNSVYLFDNAGHPFYSMKNAVVRPDINQVLPQWQKIANAAHGTPVLLSTQQIIGQANSKKYVFSVVRQIVDPMTFSPIGMIAIDTNIRIINDIVQDMDQATHGTTIIVDDDARVIFDSKKSLIGQNLKNNDIYRQATDSAGNYKATINGESALIIYKKSPETGWKVFIIVPEKDLKADSTKTRNFTLLTAIAIMCFALVISIVLIFTVTKPLRLLVRMMKDVQTGNLDVVFPPVRQVEVNLVGSAFNRMIDRIKILIEDIYRVEQRKKKVELQSLQHQINPHFIYNSLESIRMTALIHDDPELEEMTELLGRLIRYSIHGDLNTVPLQQEWDHLKMFIQLLNYRFGNRFNLQLPSSEVTGNMEIIKLLFQPIVENAINHGIDEYKDSLTITITYCAEEMNHVFIIHDNGCGIERSKLVDLNLRLQGRRQQHDTSGIGLYNVQERIMLQYGENYGITIESILGEGTKVYVKFPRKGTGESERS